ncbi:MAG: hypothetical protein JJLCMIEE_03122 [Acidimicrobiales bacterium]|nr:hypothetical protein [Acidimicrobiales bacterium]
MSRSAGTKRGRFARLLAAVAVIAVIAVTGLPTPAGAADHEWAILTNDPDPCNELLGVCVGGEPDARQDDAITMSAELCYDSGFFDVCTDLTVGWNNLADDGASSVNVQYDLDGNGTADATEGPYSSGTIDSCDNDATGYGCTINHTFAPNTVGPGAYDSATRVCSASNPSSCSSWETWSILGIQTDYDVTCAPGVDNDGDGVPCEFDPDGDTQYFAGSNLNCVNSDIGGTPVDIEHLGSLNFSTATTNGFCAASFLGLFKFMAGQFLWVDVDFIGQTGLKDTLAKFWATTVILSQDSGDVKEAYIGGIGLCIGPDAGSIFGFKLAVCNFQASFQDDDNLLGVDEFQIKAVGTGFNIAYGFDGDGNRDPAISLLNGWDITTN